MPPKKFNKKKKFEDFSGSVECEDGLYKLKLCAFTSWTIYGGNDINVETISSIVELSTKTTDIPSFLTFFQHYRSRRSTLFAVHVNDTHFSASEKSIQKRERTNERTRKASQKYKHQIQKSSTH